MHKADSIIKQDVVVINEAITDVATILRAINKNLVVAIQLLINIRTNQATMIKTTGGKLITKETEEGKK